MSQMIIKIILGIVMSTSAFIIVKKILNYEEKINFLKIFGAILLITSPTLVLYDVKYNLIFTLLVFIIMSISFKYLFKTDITSSILSCGFVMLSTAFADILISTIETLFFSYEQVRNLWYINLINNVLVSIICILIIQIRKVVKIIRFFIEKIEKNNRIKGIFFTTLIITVLAMLYYNVTSIFKINTQYIMTIVAILIFFILYYIYIDERNNYEKLKDEYNIIFSYFQTFEDWIDNEQLYRHELKNNLSIIRGLTTKKVIKQKIDDMLNMSIIIDEKDIDILKKIPKGGLKGLLYYKLAIAKKQNINVLIDISPKITKDLNSIQNTLMKHICIVLGIYLDNAIEATEISKDKNVTIEIYKIEDKINFVISNTYKKMIPIDQMGKKGFSTKGKGRGRGLYFANKLIKKEQHLESEQVYMNNFFVQKLMVK